MKDRKGFTTVQPSSSMAVPMIAKPLSLYWRSKLMNQGISILQGPHQVAQKSTKTTLPRKSDKRTTLPLASFNSKSGAFLRSFSGLREDAEAARAGATLLGRSAR